MYRIFTIVCLLTFTFFDKPIQDKQQKAAIPDKQPREIHLTTPGLSFNPVRFNLKPGEKVKLILENIDEMSHNMVITKPGERKKVVSLAAKLIDKQGEIDFIPNSNLVLTYIPMLKPGEKFSKIFEAPEEEGIYPYVCTFPGHGTIMYGAIYVSEERKMPDLQDDPNIPDKDKEANAHTMHKASMKELPALYRTFMPHSGPASIAVGMPGNISYCWDAGACRLRYAWHGGFVDLEKNWSGNGNDKAEVIGTVFYRDQTDFPIRIGSKNNIPKPDYKGYSLRQGLPTFKYFLNDVQISERITPLEGQQGFQREFSFSNLRSPLWFLRDASDKKITIDGDQGKWEGNYFKLNPGEETTLKIIVTNEG